MEQKKSFLPKLMAILATAMGALAVCSFFMEMFAVFMSSTGFEAFERFSKYSVYSRYSSILTIALICCIMGLIFSGVSILKEKFAIGTIASAVLGMCFMIAYPVKIEVSVLTGFYIYLAAELLAIFFALMVLTGTPASGETRKAGRVMAMIAIIGACLAMACLGLVLSYEYNWDHYTGFDMIRTWRDGLSGEDYCLLFGIISTLAAILFAAFSRGRKKFAVGSIVATAIGIIGTSICVFTYREPAYGYVLYLVAAVITIVFSILRLAMSICNKEDRTDIRFCKACGWENPLDVQFCRHCGTTLIGRACQICGTQNPDGTKFCGSCGAPLVSSPVAPVPPVAYAPVPPVNYAPVGYSAPVPAIVVCPRCRTKHPAGTSFCTTCGTSIR